MKEKTLVQQLADANNRNATLVQQLADANNRNATLGQYLADATSRETLIKSPQRTDRVIKDTCADAWAPLSETTAPRRDASGNLILGIGERASAVLIEEQIEAQQRPVRSRRSAAMGELTGRARAVAGANSDVEASLKGGVR